MGINLKYFALLFTILNGIYTFGQVQPKTVVPKIKILFEGLESGATCSKSSVDFSLVNSEDSNYQIVSIDMYVGEEYYWTFDTRLSDEMNNAMQSYDSGTEIKFYVKIGADRKPSCIVATTYYIE